MKLKEVIEILEGEELVLPSGGNTIDIQTVCSSDLMSDLLHYSVKSNSVLVTGLINMQVVRTAEIADIKAIAFVLGKRPDPETAEMARQKGVALFTTRLSRFSACGRLYAAGLKSCTGEDR